MHGSALMTVTGVTDPSSENNCVIPSFLPIIPLTILTLRLQVTGYRLEGWLSACTLSPVPCPLFVVLAEGLDLDINSSRQVKLHQRVDCLRRRIEYVHQPLVRS